MIILQMRIMKPGITYFVQLCISVTLQKPGLNPSMVILKFWFLLIHFTWALFFVCMKKKEHFLYLFFTYVLTFSVEFSSDSISHHPHHVGTLEFPCKYGFSPNFAWITICYLSKASCFSAECNWNPNFIYVQIWLSVIGVL